MPAQFRADTRSQHEDSHKASQAETYPPDIIKRPLDAPQLLPHEDSNEFLQLFATFEDYGKSGSPATTSRCIKPRC
jgi:hypothetical protein